MFFPPSVNFLLGKYGLNHLVPIAADSSASKTIADDRISLAALAIYLGDTKRASKAPRKAGPGEAHIRGIPCERRVRRAPPTHLPSGAVGRGRVVSSDQTGGDRGESSPTPHCCT